MKGRIHMAFDGIALNMIASELNHSIIGAKVNKIFEPTEKDIILGLYGAGKHVALHICIDPQNGRFHLTTRQKPNPLVAPQFCMLLRKHLVGAKLLAIHTFDLERVCKLEFETRNELQDRTIKKLVIEIMGSHSNIILTNEQNTIIDAIKHVSAEAHQIMPAHIYMLPVNTKQSFLQVTDFSKFLEILSPVSAKTSIDKQISDHFLGISRSFLNNLLDTMGLPKVNLTLEELEALYHAIKEISTNMDGLLFKKVEHDYFPIKAQKTDFLFANSFFLDDFYAEKETQEKFVSKRQKLLTNLQTQLKKYARRLENISSKLKDCNNMEQYRLYGELITANLYRFKNETLSSITVPNYYDENKEVTIELDARFSLSKNAALYFKKYNKLKNTLEIVSVQKKETELELDYLESILFSIENSKTYDNLEEIENEIMESSIFQSHKKQKITKKQDKKEHVIDPMKFEFQGFTILAGKNNKQNDLLTLKVASRDDLWFHTQKIQGSHVILKVEGKKVSNEVIAYCAKLAKENSKARHATNVPVDYCMVKYIKKPSNSKPGMVIYREFKTIIVK